MAEPVIVQEELLRSNRDTLKRLLVVVVLMFAFGFLMVPFYNKICEVTGINQIDAAEQGGSFNSQVDLTRTIQLELDTNTRDLPWDFRPLQKVVAIHPGELVQVDFEVTNRDAHSIVGQAIPSFSPLLAARYVKKLECFCFTQQTFKPHERRVMPVVFVVDPDLPKEIQTVTLSYTFFLLEGGGKVLPAVARQ